MRGLLNDVDKHFKGSLKVINVPRSKKAFCYHLNCTRCGMFKIPVGGDYYAFVHQTKGERTHPEWGRISCTGPGGGPEWLGSFILFGIRRNGKLRSLSRAEIRFLKKCFNKCEYPDGRVKYMLFWD